MDEFRNQYDESIMKLLQKADSLKKEGQYKEAIGILHKVLIAESECTEAYEELGDNFLSLRDLENAERALDQAVKINEKSPNARYLRGFLYSLQNKWDVSIEELKLADSIFPNHPEILRCLGWSIYNGKRSLQGIAVLERSRTLSPTDPNILCDLGVCYMNHADFSRAKEIFTKVIRLFPQTDQATECGRFLKLMEQDIAIF